jgi:hypothetical protein
MSLDIENNDAFSIRELSSYYNDRTPVPSHLGDLGIFEEKGIRSSMFAIEQKSNQLALVPTKPVNSPGTPVDGNKGKRIPFETSHLPLEATIYASEVDNARELGTDDEFKSLTSEVNERQDDMADDLDATHEHFRIGAIKGKILDSDGVTEIDDLYAKFGMTQTTFATDFETPATNATKKILEMLNVMNQKMLGKYYKGLRVICGENFFGTFATRADVRDAFARFNDGEWLRDDPRAGFKYGGNIIWEQYTGQVGNYKFVGDDDAYVIPMDTRKMFMTYFSPANHNDVVNTKGVPYYTTMETLKHGMGYETKTQSNIFCLNRNPQGVIKLSLGA